MIVSNIKKTLSMAGSRLCLYLLFGIAVPLLILWGTVAIRFSNLPGEALPVIASWLYFFITVALFLLMRNMHRALVIFAVVQVLVTLWSILIEPSNDRQWLPDVARMPEVEFNNSLVHIKNVRNFHYRSTTDYDIDYYDETYNLDKLQATDLIISHWDGLQGIAHTFLSFRFSDGKVLCLSVEVRREQGEAYSTAKGFFKQFELIYVIGDEKDILQLRTNFRGEETYLYPTQLNKKHSYQLLTSLLQGAEKLRHQAKFYNTFGQNCTTTLVDHINDLDHVNVAPHRKLLLNGVSDQFAYEQGMLDNKLPFPVIKKCCFISELAQPFKGSKDFSQKIREQVQLQLEAEYKKRSIL